MRLGLLSCAILLKVAPIVAANDAGPTPEVHTFSIVAFDPVSGDLGVAVQSKYFGVGSVVPWARAGFGAIATQASAKVSFGPEGLKLLESGKAPREILDALLENDRQREVRQCGIVDAKGRVAVHTGAKCNAWAGHLEREHFAVQGNLLTGEEVVRAMADAFEKARATTGSELADWLLASLEAGQAAGGDKRGQQSAALLVVREKGGPGGDNDGYVDLRVEDHTEPIKELARLLKIHTQFYARAHAARPRREK